MSSIELEGVGKTFPNGVTAVDSVTMAVERGELLALVGSSGSGKSTLLRLIAGLDKPTTGTIRIDGVDMTHQPPRARDVAMVFQEPALYPYLNVLDNLAFGLRARGTSKREVTSRLAWVAGALKIEGLLSRRPATLSGGQQRRVALGRALARRPAVFLLDEPLTGLDAPLRAALRDELIDPLRATGAAILYVTHDQAEALALGDRVAMIDHGRLAQIGSPSEIYERPAARSVAAFIGNPPMNFVTDAQLMQGATRAGVLGIRPEHLAIALDGKDRDPTFQWLAESFQVVRVEFLGSDATVTVTRPPLTLRVKASASTPARPGMAVALGVDWTRVSWFDATTGRRLPAESGLLANDVRDSLS